MGTDWGIDPEGTRYTTVHSRYHICEPICGLIDAVSRLSDAFRIGDDHAERVLTDGAPFCARPFEIEVYDSMAREGYAQVWRRQPKRGTYCMEHGDKITMRSRWKVIRRKGVADPCLDDMTTRLWVKS